MMRSICRPPTGSESLPRSTIVRTYTMRSPFFPEIFAQSSGFVVFGGNRVHGTLWLMESNRS